MNRSVLLTLIVLGVVVGCRPREEPPAKSAENAASPPAAMTAPAPGETVSAEPAPEASASGEVPPSPSAPATPAEEPAAEEDTVAGADDCNVEPVQNLVGQMYTPELGEQARVTAGARVERALRPGQIVTMEFRADRLSFTLDEKGRISRVTCG